MCCIWCSNPEGMKKGKGKELSINELLEEVLRSKMMFFNGGGVTFTGGEPTLQFEELKEILIKLKENNIHTAIETNGTSTKLKELLPYIDYLIMDFKHYDSDIHEKYTGLKNNIIKDNIKYISTLNYKLHIRIPLINGINTQNINEYIKFFKSINTNNIDFEFLAYHEYGKSKWQEEYLVKDGFITSNTLKNFINEFKENNLKIVNT